MSGLDPNNDVHWVTSQETGMEAGSMQLFIDGKIDAFFHSATAADAPRPKDRPLDSQHGRRPTVVPHYCCTIAASADYISKYPVTTKRVLRAILKAADLCVSQPRLVAQQLIDRGFDKNYDLVLQTLWPMYATTGGETSTLRTRFGSTPCGCRKSA